MPYDIAKGFDGCPYAVVKLTPDGKELAPGGCHQTAIEAGKHLAALEAATDYEDRAAGEWVIVDIDGTLTTSDGSDEPRESLVSWMRANDYSYAIVSARPESRLDETRAWLESNDIPHSSVSLSDFPQGPNAGVAFKKNKAEQLIKNHKIVFAIDNDPAARSAYESVGVKSVGPTTVRYFQLGLELRADGYAPNNAMKAEARRGLEWRAEFNRGGTEIGVARARDIMNGRNLSLDTVRRMVSYFARHEVDKQGEGWSPGEPGYPSAGRIAWALWGGNPGRSWANAISESEDKDRSAESEQELRHPGHGDQSVHNPHKGGSGFVRPVAIQRTIETEMAEKFTDEEWKATAYAHRLTPEIKDDKALPSEVPTPEEVKAIQSYQYGSGKFQQSLLHPNTEPDSLGEVKAFRGVLERNSLQEDTTLYRGIGGAVGNSQMAAKLQEAGVGGIVQSDRFVSSAANSRVASAFGEADLVIKAPAGTKGAYLDRILYAEPSYASVRKYDVQAARKIAIPGRGEAEFVMPPGVKFKVDSIGQNPSNGRAVFEVTVVP